MLTKNAITFIKLYILSKIWLILQSNPLQTDYSAKCIDI